MFPMHDHTRRLFCRAAWLLLGVGPLLAVGYWCFTRHGASLTAAEAQRLSRQLGVDVELADLRHVLPGTLRYDGLSLVDPETHQALIRCRWIQSRIQPLPDSQHALRPTLHLTCTEPELNADGCAELARLLEMVMQSRTALGDLNLRLTLGDVTVRAGAAAHRLCDVEATVENAPGGVQADMKFRLAGSSGGEPAWISVGRNRQLAPPATGIQIRTGDSLLPCSLLALVAPQFAQAGPDAWFQGWFWANRTADGGSPPDGCTGELAGQFSGLDLDLLSSAWSVHKLSGTGQMVLHTVFQNGRMQWATGRLAAGPGVVSRSLLAVADQLGLAPGIQPPGANDLAAYDELAVPFEISQRGFLLGGDCNHTTPGTVLAERYQTLLAQRNPSIPAASQPRLPVEWLVRALAPPDANLVPANTASARLMHLLPIAAGTLSQPLLSQRPHQ